MNTTQNTQMFSEIPENLQQVYLLMMKFKEVNKL
jgi:hypothetical protein